METIKGKVKWFNSRKGYGYITDLAGRDYFVHYTDIIMEGFRVLHQSEPVEFTPLKSDKGLMASNVTVINGKEEG